MDRMVTKCCLMWIVGGITLVTKGYLMWTASIVQLCNPRYKKLLFLTEPKFYAKQSYWLLLIDFGTRILLYGRLGPIISTVWKYYRQMVLLIGFDVRRSGVGTLDPIPDEVGRAEQTDRVRTNCMWLSHAHPTIHPKTPCQLILIPSSFPHIFLAFLSGFPFGTTQNSALLCLYRTISVTVQLYWNSLGLMVHSVASTTCGAHRRWNTSLSSTSSSSLYPLINFGPP